MTEEWYKRYPARAIAGMAKLTLEERGAYNSIIDHLYLFNRPLPDDDAWIAGHLTCSVRVWQRIKRSLVSKGRLIVKDGKIDDERAQIERGERKVLRQKRVEAGRIGGSSGDHSSIMQRTMLVAAAKPEEFDLPGELNSNDLFEAHASPRQDKRREEENLYIDQFEEFWALWPKKRRIAKPKARAAFQKAVKDKRAVPANIIDGLRRHLPLWLDKAAEFIPHPSTWLNQDRFNDPVVIEKARPNGQGWVVEFGCEEFDAWRKHYARQNNPAEFDFRRAEGHTVKVPTRWPPARRE
jgi:uncharacterized protein YdaU (DUF1376 family)